MLIRKTPALIVNIKNKQSRYLTECSKCVLPYATPKQIIAAEKPLTKI